MSRPAVWLVGDASEPEFEPLRAWLASHVESRAFPAEEAPQELLAGDVPVRPPALVVFCSARPHAMAAPVARRWQARFPLARFAVVLGSWCEGETRTGRPWPGVVRWYWHQAVFRLEDWLARERVAGSPWRLPWTATDAEWIEASVGTSCGARAAADRAPNESRRNVALWSAGPERGAVVREACVALGWGVVACEQGGDGDGLPASAALILDWDEHPEWSSYSGDAAPWRWVGRLPALGLLGFPRRQDQAEASKRGLSLLAKPWRLADLRAWLEVWADPSPSRVLESMG